MFLSFFVIVAEFYVMKGPPCQSFSRANHKKVLILLTSRSKSYVILQRRDDIRQGIFAF